MKHLHCCCLRFGSEPVNPNRQKMQALYLLQTIKFILWPRLLTQLHRPGIYAYFWAAAYLADSAYNVCSLVQNLSDSDSGPRFIALIFRCTS